MDQQRGWDSRRGQKERRRGDEKERMKRRGGERERERTDNTEGEKEEGRLAVLASAAGREEAAVRRDWGRTYSSARGRS